MSDRPYEVTYIKDSKERTVIQFGRWESDVYDRMIAQGITAATIRPAGRPAEARVRSTLRGGMVYDGVFYYPDGKGPQSVPISEVTDLKYHEQG